MLEATFSSFGSFLTCLPPWPINGWDQSTNHHSLMDHVHYCSASQNLQKIKKDKAGGIFHDSYHPTMALSLAKRHFYFSRPSSNHATGHTKHSQLARRLGLCITGRRAGEVDCTWFLTVDIKGVPEQLIQIQRRETGVQPTVITACTVNRPGWGLHCRWASPLPVGVPFAYELPQKPVRRRCGGQSPTTYRARVQALEPSY